MKIRLFLLLSVGTLNPSVSASTCGCGALPEDTLEQFSAAVSRAYDQATVVFSAIVVAFEYRALSEADSENPEAAKVKVIRFRVDRWWKGEEADEVVLYTNEMAYPDGSGWSSGCEYPFKVGKMYVVYASESKGKRLQADACSRTKPTEYAEKEMVELTDIKAKKGPPAEGR